MTVRGTWLWDGTALSAGKPSRNGLLPGLRCLDHLSEQAVAAAQDQQTYGTIPSSEA